MGVIYFTPILILKTYFEGIYMPIYEYKCDCGKEFEVHQSIQAEKFKDCSEVGYFECNKPNKLQRLVSRPTLLKLGHLSDKKLREELGDNIDS